MTGLVSAAAIEPGRVYLAQLPADFGAYAVAECEVRLEVDAADVARLEVVAPALDGALLVLVGSEAAQRERMAGWGCRSAPPSFDPAGFVPGLYYLGRVGGSEAEVMFSVDAAGWARLGAYRIGGTSPLLKVEGSASVLIEFMAGPLGCAPDRLAE